MHTPKRKYLTEEQLEELIDKYDPDDIIDILGVDTEQLVILLEHYIADRLNKFELDSDDYQEAEE